MPFRVFRVPSSERARIDQALGDDILSRQSIALRDARHFGMTGNDVYVFVEGSEQGVFRADELFAAFATRAEDEETLHRKLKAEDDDAASGLGAIFG